MGKYINTISNGQTLPAIGKADVLVKDGAKILSTELTYKPYQPNIVCIVNNGFFEAAGYAYSEDEFNAFQGSVNGDYRPRTWLLYEHAAILAK